MFATSGLYSSISVVSIVKHLNNTNKTSEKLNLKSGNKKQQQQRQRQKCYTPLIHVPSYATTHQ